MVREFKLPDVGEGVAEGELVQWLVEEGEAVTEDQPVAEVETDKALVEIPSPVNGTVRERRVEEGEVVPVGTVIITFDVEGEEAEESTTESAEPVEESDERGAVESETAEAAADAGADRTEEAESSPDTKRVFAPPSVRRLARELGVDLQSVDGSGPGGRVTEGDVRAAVDDEGAGPETVEETEETATDAIAEAEAAISKAEESIGEEPPTHAETGPSTENGAEISVSGAAERDRTLAAPATRRIARELGVDLDAVPSVEKRDGEAFVTPEAVREFAEQRERVEQRESAEEAPASAVAQRDREAREERVPYRGTRRSIGEHMERSAFTIPHVTHHDTADVTELVRIRSELKTAAEERGVRLTYVPFVMKACVGALREFPEVNSELDEEAEEVVLKNYYNLGVATATEQGLLVPVVRDVDRKGLLQLALDVNELSGKARERTISPEEMQGGTFTITNVGAIGGEYATPIVNYPEVAILALGAIREKPRVVDGEIVPRHVLPLSLSFDHRVIDGAVAAEFTNEIVRRLENPSLLLLE